MSSSSGKKVAPRAFLTQEAIEYLEGVFEEFQFLNDARMESIRKKIGQCFKCSTISEWFKNRRAQEIAKHEKPGAERVLPSEMALLHLTYERVPDVNKMNFTAWAKVHDITEADVKLYFRERDEREAALIAAQDRAPAGPTGMF
ncbi:hypothetical protein B9Z55_025192 [Caenorhabditis nigoni]|uniref:Homeobox domain-containing protein n=1 Tax=Caenorhabditis nigoni TaxID=1611254 RepID=A0A2G5SY48_9PELO|nr:hypothetical protein B9Z55_025192 [Caenorhabditis nigoni]